MHIATAVVLAVAAGGVYGVYGTNISRGSRGSADPTDKPTASGTAAAPGAGGTASSPLPPYLHIQARDAGCGPVNYYNESPAQYEQHPRQGGRSVGEGTIDITNQTSSDEAVLLTGLRIRVLQRRPVPATGIVVADGQCGGSQTVRPFTTDLDKPAPVAIARPAEEAPDSPARPAVTFPFKILPGDPEVFELIASGTTCDCTIAVEIDWVAAGRPGSTVLDNEGRGFPVLAAPGLPAYRVDGPGYDKLVPAAYKDIVRSTYP